MAGTTASPASMVNDSIKERMLRSPCACEFAQR
jgi:hypothetical protein